MNVDLGGTIVKINDNGIVNTEEFQAKHTFGMNCSTVKCEGGATRVSKSGLLFCKECMEDYRHIMKLNFRGGLAGIIYLVMVSALQRKRLHQAKSAKLLNVSTAKMCRFVGKLGIKSKNPYWRINGTSSVSNVTSDNKIRVLL